MNDSLIYASIHEAYQPPKNTVWCQQILAQTTAIFKFLKTHNLLLVDPFDAHGELDKDFVLRESHVTLIGSKMFEKVIPNWQKARDRDKLKPEQLVNDYSNIQLLEKGLMKLQGEAKK
jgi:hypothetical protein